ncbi:MAG TPA: sporulation protein [Chitinophagales bacterium]|nr:sporulation protein [Chitinophagales bacterium]
MSFFSKIKQALGIGTISVKINAPGQLNAADGKLKGSLFLTAKSDQKVKKMEVKLEEEQTTGRGDNKKIQTYTIGSWNDNSMFEMKTGETKTVEFEFPVQVYKSSTDQLAEKGGMLGGLGKMAKFADDTRSEFKVCAIVDVDGAKLDPSDSCNINIIK